MNRHTTESPALFYRLLGVVACLCLSVLGEGRFPQPEFDTGYTAPVHRAATLPSAWHGWADIALLALCLSLASYFALRRRSRRGLFWLSLFSLAYFGFWRRGCVCSVGALQNVSEAVFGGAAVPLATLALFLLPLFFALFFGRVFCASVCPLGALQDVVGFWPRKLPRGLAQALRVLPVAHLGFAVLLAATGVCYITCEHDPLVPLLRLAGAPAALVFGCLTLALGMVVARPYCRFICPYGVLLGWLSKLSWKHLTITPDTCVSCRLCEQSCPYDAIRVPAPDRPAESLLRGTRRLGAYLALVPALMFVGGWVTSGLAPHFVRLNQDALVLEQLRLEGDGPPKTVETEAFRSGSESVPILASRVESMELGLRRGGWWCGAFIGLVLGARLLRHSVRVERRGYEPDQEECMSCGRCFASCPREHLRLAARTKQKEGEGDDG
ncbi:MAG: 4Fe-4S binding protein [Lentisphaeria bacterium]|nr:4Fe-4S binding protein [Lentisphaeria bacterium]